MQYKKTTIGIEKNKYTAQKRWWSVIVGIIRHIAVTCSLGHNQICNYTRHLPHGPWLSSSLFNTSYYPIRLYLRGGSSHHHFHLDLSGWLKVPDTSTFLRCCMMPFLMRYNATFSSMWTNIPTVHTRGIPDSPRNVAGPFLLFRNGLIFTVRWRHCSCVLVRRNAR